MKKLLTTALGCLLFCALAVTAAANEWGLSGGVYDIVTQGDRYEGYTALTDDGNRLLDGTHVNHAILKNRYHALLISAHREGRIWQADHVVTTAVYQPGDKRGEYPNAPVLEHIDEGFKLSYGDSETYTFYEEDGEYILVDVRYCNDEMYTDCFVLEDSGFGFWQSNPADAFLPVGDARWNTDCITLVEFNINQMPRSMAEVRRVNQVSAALAQAPLLEAAGNLEGAKNAGRLAVYAAPDIASYRSAGGKASVSLGGDVQVFGSFGGWTLIQYEVSPRTSRIGYVEKELSGKELIFTDVPLMAAADTFLTDDPFVSQYAQAEIPKGAQLTGLARCGEYYAYVEYCAQEKLCRGFVPLKDLTTTYDRAMTTGTDRLMADVRWDVIDAMCGKWYPQGGSWQDQTILFSDGSYRRRRDGSYYEEGNFRIHDAGSGAYTLYMCTESNQETVYTLRLNEDGTITLHNESGETVYRRDEYSTYGNG